MAPFACFFLRFLSVSKPKEVFKTLIFVPTSLPTDVKHHLAGSGTMFGTNRNQERQSGSRKCTTPQGAVKASPSGCFASLDCTLLAWFEKGKPD